MLNTEHIRTVVGVIGNVISFGLFLSPAPTFRRIIKKKSVEEFSPVPYIAAVLNCLFWVFYGMPFVHPDSTLVITINAIGLVFELVYLLIFFVFAQWNGRRKVLYMLCGEIIFFVAMVVIALLTMHGTTKRSMLIGIMCDVFNIIMYFSPLTVMFKVIKTKSVEFMPFWLSVANFLNGSVWTVYALLRFDIYILISNGLGAFSGAIQLILYAWYYKSTPKHVDDSDFGGKPAATTEVQLSNTTRA